MEQSSKDNSLLPPLWVLTLLTTAFGIYLLIELQEILILVVVSFSIAYVMEPPISWLERRRVPRALGFLSVLAGVLLVLAVLALTALPTIAREYHQLVGNFSSYVNQVREVVLPLMDKYKIAPPLRELIESPLTLLSRFGTPEVASKIWSGVSGALIGGFSFTLVFINLILLPFITFYLSMGFPALRAGVLELVKQSRRERVGIFLDDLNSCVSAFVRGQFAVCTILFCLYAAALGLIGIELWFLVAFVAGFANFVPFLGVVSGILLGTIMALVTFGDLWHLLGVWLVFLVVPLLDGNFITPKVIGSKVGVSPLMVILGIIIGGKLFGLLGVFLAVPVAAMLKVLWRYGRNWVWEHA